MKVETVKYLLVATSLISINKKVAQKSSISFKILKSMVTLLNSPAIFICFDIADVSKIFRTISNLIFGETNNLIYFFESNGTEKLL
mmetsp:Transcript_15418/g.23718  ORF Transcript_15418/g.23718 Transcript_15418/m.23718 type:complete len:86 (+) Transcript_15418:2702-2959(+)